MSKIMGPIARARKYPETTSPNHTHQHQSLIFSPKTTRRAGKGCMSLQNTQQTPYIYLSILCIIFFFEEGWKTFENLNEAK